MRTSRFSAAISAAAVVSLVLAAGIAPTRAEADKPPTYRDLLDEAQELTDEGKYEEAAAAADRAVKLAPKEAYGYLLRGQARLLRFNQQRGTMQVGFNYDKFKLRNLRERADLMRINVDLAEAIKLYGPHRPAISHHGRAHAFATQGLVKMLMGDWDGVIADQTEALKESQDRKYYHYRALAKYHKKDYRGAVDDFTARIDRLRRDLEKPISEKPIDLAKAYYDRGRANYALGAQQAVIDDWNTAIKIVERQDDEESREFVIDVKADLAQISK